MNSSRRQTLQAAGGVGLYGALAAIGMAPVGAARAQQKFNPAAFQAKSVPDTLKALGAEGGATSSEIAIIAPDIAENGAVVPVGIKSNLPNTEFVALLVAKNPSPLAGAYDILPGTQAEVNMRIKMGQSSDVYAVVRADGKYYVTKKEIKVTLGGCGG